jgi:hypothetical protein
MKDESGHLLVPGWYDDVVPLGDAERRPIAAIAEHDDTGNRLWEKLPRRRSLLCCSAHRP